MEDENWNCEVPQFVRRGERAANSAASAWMAASNCGRTKSILRDIECIEKLPGCRAQLVEPRLSVLRLFPQPIFQGLVCRGDVLGGEKLRKMSVDENGRAVIMCWRGDYAAVGKFLLPRCEKSCDALEIFVSAEQHKRSHVRGVLRIAGCQESQPTRKTERDHGHGTGAQSSLEPCGRCADCGYRSGVHVIVGERGEHWRQDSEPAGGEGAGKIYESRIVNSEMVHPGKTTMP